MRIRKIPISRHPTLTIPIAIVQVPVSAVRPPVIALNPDLPIIALPVVVDEQCTLLNNR